MVRREQWEKIINRLENFRAVPIWESGNSVISLLIVSLLANSSAVPELLYPLHTSRLAVHLIPATRHPEASHANLQSIST